MKTIHTDISENGHNKADLPLKQALLEMVGCPRRDLGGGSWLQYRLFGTP